MAIRMMVTDVAEVSDGIWIFEMPPHQIKHFGHSACAIDQRSVLLLAEHRYDRAARTLDFDVDSVSAINVGTTSMVVGIGSLISQSGLLALGMPPAPARAGFGPGDSEFLRLTESEFSSDMRTAALKLLTGVREKSPGDLKLGNPRNFSETPDGYWEVILRPKSQLLAIIVRGAVGDYAPTARLPVKSDGDNTMVKLSASADVEAALEIILKARSNK